MSDDGRRKNPLSFFFLKQRHHSVPTKKNPSSSNIAKPKGIFGAPLEYGAECGSITPRGLQVPDPVYRCMNEVIQRGYCCWVSFLRQNPLHCYINMRTHVAIIVRLL